MNVIDRIDHLRRLYRFRVKRSPASFVSVPESALVELARAMELGCRSRGHYAGNSLYVPAEPSVSFHPFDDAAAAHEMRLMIEGGRVFLFGLQLCMGDYLAVGCRP